MRTAHIHARPPREFLFLCGARPKIAAAALLEGPHHGVEQEVAFRRPDDLGRQHVVDVVADARVLRSLVRRRGPPLFLGGYH